MKQFGTIFKFELKDYIANKVFVRITLFLVLAIIVVMFFPRIKESFADKDEVLPAPGESIGVGDINDGDRSGLPIMLISAPDQNADLVYEVFFGAFSDYDVRLSEMTVKEVKASVENGDAECAFVMNSPTSFTYYVQDLSIQDANAQSAYTLIERIYYMNAMLDSGMSFDDVLGAFNEKIDVKTEALGVDQMDNYWYTYIMIFALYIVIILYGQMVATNVATEKSSRAMEVLITSAKPTSMMFGKVLASCLAGFVQLALVFGTAFVCFNMNKSYWDKTGMISAMFDIPLDILLYMLVFFVLGFLIYAFLYGAVGSTVSKLEDINTAVMPITYVYIIAFIVVMFSLGGSMETPLMLVCSYIPFTSPMAMFTRIAMSEVAWYEIAISVSILVASVAGVGVLSAKIYRVGVLLYGNKPKITSIIKTVLKSK